MSLTTNKTVAPLLFEVGQAMFHYCDRNEKLPVGIIHSFSDDGHLIIGFPVSSLPVAVQNSDSFAGELFFYRKAISYWVTVKGVAEICHRSPFYIRFTIQQLYVHEFAASSYRHAAGNKLEKHVSHRSYFGLSFLTTG